MKPKRKPKFRVGQVVRVTLYRDCFRKMVARRFDANEQMWVYQPDGGDFTVWYKQTDLRHLTRREMGLPPKLSIFDGQWQATILKEPR